jgi:hypothetical protein
MRDHDLRFMLVTTPEGRLLGVLRRDVAQQTSTRSARKTTVETGEPKMAMCGADELWPRVARRIRSPQGRAHRCADEPCRRQASELLRLRAIDPGDAWEASPGPMLSGAYQTLLAVAALCALSGAAGRRLDLLVLDEPTSTSTPNSLSVSEGPSRRLCRQRAQWWQPQILPLPARFKRAPGSGRA